MNGKTYDLVKELLDYELSDYSFFEKMEIEFTDTYNGHDYFDIDFPDLTCFLRMRSNGEYVEVEVGEGSFYKCEWFDSSIKHFWIALLHWPQYSK